MKPLFCGCVECGRPKVELVRNPLSLPLRLGEVEDPRDYLYAAHQMLTGERLCPNSGQVPDDFCFAFAAVTEWPVLAGVNDAGREKAT